MWLKGYNKIRFARRTGGMKVDRFGVLNWRNLDLKENIHYCDQNESTDTSEPNQVYKKDGWFLSTRRTIHKQGMITSEQLFENMDNKQITPIKFCPFCGIVLAELKDGDE